MGRPSKLSEKKWDELHVRLLKGESIRALGREFGIAPSAISERFGKKTEQLKSIANQVAATELLVRSLPLSEQCSVKTLADDLIAMSGHLASAGKYSSATAHRLSGIAHARVQEIDDAAPLTDESREALRDVGVLTKLANDASTIPINLLHANKDTVKRLNEEPAVEDELTQERLTEGARRIAFALTRAALPS